MAGGVAVALAKVVGAAVTLTVVTFALVNDTVNAAIVAGVFSLVNTLLSITLLKRTKHNQDVIHDTKRIVDQIAESPEITSTDKETTQDHAPQEFRSH